MESNRDNKIGIIEISIIIVWQMLQILDLMDTTFKINIMNQTTNNHHQSTIRNTFSKTTKQTSKYHHNRTEPNLLMQHLSDF